MAILKWTEDLRIGITGIDDQHRQLVSLINELHLAVEYGKGEEVILPVLEKLHNYANTHFRDEEALLEHHNYPEASGHAEEHREFLARLNELQRQYRSLKEVLTVHVKNYLRNWFFTHIQIEDMKYKTFLESKHALAEDFTPRP